MVGFHNNAFLQVTLPKKNLIFRVNISESVAEQCQSVVHKVALT